MSNIVPFEFEGAAIRTVVMEGEPWFIGKDVAERLGYAVPPGSVTAAIQRRTPRR